MTRFAVMFCAVAMLAGCASDPLQDVPRLSEADVADTELQAAIREDADAATPDAAPAVPQPARRGLLGFLSGAANDAKAQSGASVDVAAVAPGAPAAVSVPSGRGPGPNDPDYQVVALGTALPYGTLARVCNVSNRELGTRVETYPPNRSTYTLFDSQPGNTAAHTFYLTGFEDGCARQFTAALAMFGAPQTHEQLRYGLPSKVQPYSTTDAAYETLKSRVCRVGKGKPCGSAMSRLARNTAFVSVYEQFGSNTIWKTILLHDGAVVDTDIRGN